MQVRTNTFPKGTPLMMQAQVAPCEKALDVFRRSNEAFETIKVHLRSHETMAMTHAEVERLLHDDGMKLLRQLLQDHLDLRSLREQEEGFVEVLGADGVERPHRRDTTRKLETLFGEVEVRREAHGARGQTSLHPLDAHLNLPKDKYSHEVGRRIAKEVACRSFDDVVGALWETTGARVGKRQVEELCVQAACDFDAFYQEQAQKALSNPTKTSVLLVLTGDGKGLVMRKEALRPATRKQAEKKVHELKHRLQVGEKNGRKRMAEVAAVYTIAPFVRTAEDIVREFRDPSVPLPVRPRPENKRVFAHVDRPAEEVLEEAFLEALHRDPERKKRWIGLVDGNAWQIETMKRLAEKYGVTLTIVVDVMHVLKYLWAAAAAFCPAGSREAEAWVTEHLFALLGGTHPGHVAAGMRRSATRRGLSQMERKPVDEAAAYLLHHADHLRYDQYLAAGLPIATGVIEGACRYLIKDRMDITGARWGLERAEAVLRLRALRTSGDFEAYWPYHEEQELRRNHAVHYANGLPVPQPPRGRPRLRLVP
jgi:hypothetical protein